MSLKNLQFAEKIELVKKASMGVPKIININLGLPLIDQIYDIAGNVFYIYSAPGDAEYVGIKVNETREPMINYTVHTGLETPFYRLFITTPAGQAGTLQIIYGTEAPELLKILDHRSTTVGGVDGILGQLAGDVTPESYQGVTTGVVAVAWLGTNVNRKAFSIQALSTNTVSVFLGFDNTVTAGGAPGTWFAELQPGQGIMIDDYRGPVYAIASAANQYGGMGEW